MQPRHGSAQRYAEALFGIALERDALDDWAAELQRIGTTVQHPEAARFLASPRGGLQAKRRVLEALVGPMTREIFALMSILLERRRIALLPALADAFADRLRAHRGIELARVTTAVDLSESERDLLAERLAAYLGRKVEVETQVEPEIIGGVVARVGDQLIDASVHGRLLALRKRLQVIR